MRYNKRTSGILKNLFVQAGIKPIHYQALQVLFTDAWREKTFCPPSTTNFLALSRTYRTKSFWEPIKDLQYRRNVEGIVHSGKGFRTEWEDVFCSGFDTTWRTLRDSCPNKAAWMRLFPAFAEKVCSQWGLPTYNTNTEDQSEPSTRPAFKTHDKASHLLENLPRHHGENCPCIEWSQDSGAFVFIVDCKPLAEVLCGRMPLKNPSLAPLFEG